VVEVKRNKYEKIILLFVLLGCRQFSHKNWNGILMLKLLLLVIKSTSLWWCFTGSDWCGWCIRLQKEVLLTRICKWAAGNVILVELDYQEELLNSWSKNKMMNCSKLSEYKGFQQFILLMVWYWRESKFWGLGNTGYVAGGPELGWLLQMEFLKK
jgi:protein disulfide-isomerase